MKTEPINQFFDDEALDEEAIKTELQKYQRILLVVFGALLALFGVALFEMAIMPAEQEIVPWLVVFLLAEAGAAFIYLHLLVAVKWRKSPLVERKTTLTQALGITWFGFVALVVRFTVGGAVLCAGPGFLFALLTGFGLYYWRYGKHPKPKAEEMFP
jgi:hypothetical protein